MSGQRAAFWAMRLNLFCSAIETGWRLIHPTLYGLRERGHVKFGVLQNRKPDPPAHGCHAGFLEHQLANPRSLPIAAMYSHASPIVRSVPRCFVGRGEVSFLERYAGRNMARRTQCIGQPLSSFLLNPLFLRLPLHRRARGVLALEHTRVGNLLVIDNPLRGNVSGKLEPTINF
jgi:hypothetical protein